MELKYALSFSSTGKKTLTWLGLITHLNNQQLAFFPEWFFHANLQIISENVDVPKLKKSYFLLLTTTF